MGKRGPKPTPTALKQARGTDRADRKPVGEEPKASKRAPRKTPEAVLARPVAYRTWQTVSAQLKTMKLLSETDRLALEHLCLAQADYADAQAMVVEMGLLIRGGHGGLVANPAVAMARQARLQVHRLLAEFGLTPSARTKVRGAEAKPSQPNGQDKSDPAKNPDGFLFGARAGRVVGAIGS